VSVFWLYFSFAVARWHFAYESVLGETVRPRRNMWSWEHIKRHRKVCREYKEAYRQQQLAGSNTALPIREKIEVYRGSYVIYCSWLQYLVIL